MFLQPSQVTTGYKDPKSDIPECVSGVVLKPRTNPSCLIRTQFKGDEDLQTFYYYKARCPVTIDHEDEPEERIRYFPGESKCPRIQLNDYYVTSADVNGAAEPCVDGQEVSIIFWSRQMHVL